jgi:hypothetical protein
LTQTGAVVLGGGTSSAIDSGGGAITLTNSGNQFQSLDIANGGAVSIMNNASAMTLSSLATTTSLNLYSIGNLTLGATNFSVSGSGDAMVLRTDGAFVHSGSTQTLSAPNGRWLIYLKNPGGHTFLSTPAFKQYNAAYGDTVLGTGNGVLYNNTTPAVLTASLTGAVSKAYDGTTSISLTGATLTSMTGFVEAFTPVGTVSISGAGTLGDPNVGSAISVTAAGATVNEMVDSSGFKVYGYRVNATGAIGTVTQATVVPALPGVTVAAFLEKFEAALQAQQDSKDDKSQGKDTLVVEGDICRP